MAQRKALSVIQKQEIIRLACVEKKTQQFIADQFNCDRTTVSKIVKNKDYWNSVSSKLENSERIRQGWFSALDSAVFLWVATQRSNNFTVHAYSIKAKALELAGEVGINDFKASGNWLRGFIIALNYGT